MVTVNNTFKNKDIQNRKDVLNQLFLFIIKENLSGTKSDANEKNAWLFFEVNDDKMYYTRFNGIYQSLSFGKEFINAVTKWY